MIDLDHVQAGMRRIERLNLGLSAGAAAASLALAGPEVAGSVVVGAALEALNFRSLHHSSRQFFQGMLGGSGLWMGVAGLRLAVLLGAVVLALVAGAHPVGLLIGLSMLLPAVLIDAWRHRPAVVAQPDWVVPPPDDPSWDHVNLWRPGSMLEPHEEDWDEEREAR